MKSYSIGRDLGCDIVMNDHTDVISRRHAVLTVSSSGKMTITDQSSNGTYVNGIKISPNVPVPVTRKDSVSFAHVSTLDWNMIPKSRTWVTYLIVALAVAALAALLVLFLTRERNPNDSPSNGVPVTDTIKGKDVQTPAVTDPALDSTKIDTVKQKKDTIKDSSTKVSTQKKQTPKDNKTKEKEKNEKKENTPKAKNDSVQHKPRPIGV